MNQVKEARKEAADAITLLLRHRSLHAPDDIICELAGALGARLAHYSMLVGVDERLAVLATALRDFPAESQSPDPPPPGTINGSP